MNENKDKVLSRIEHLADKYGITLVSAEENAKCNGANRNNMSCCGSIIFLNEFDDPDIELAAFFHELGHVEVSRTPYLRQSGFFCKISQEAVAWEFGISIAIAEGYKWGYYSKELQYARKCLASYIDCDGGGFS